MTIGSSSPMFEELPARARDVRRVLTWVVGGALVWLALIEADPRTPLLGAVVVLAAVVFGLALAPPRRTRISASGLLRFVPRFLWLSLSGGVDVALRAFRGPQALHPDLYTFRTRLPASSPGVALLAIVISLIPGTLCVDVEQDRLTLHVLDHTQDHEQMLRDLEERIARVVRTPLREGRTA